MHTLIKKIHMYVGLLNFTILLVFGIAGLSATFEEETVMQRKTPSAVEYRDFVPPPNASDGELARRVYGAAKIPLAAPVPARRNAQNQVVLDFWTPTGIH